jgi:cytoskeletal protein RodZ
MGKKGLKGMLLMAACCGAPLLLLLVLPVVGSALGGLGVSALSTLALLACPVGMGLMMWLMMRGQQAGPQQPAQEQRTLSQEANVATVQPQEEALLPDSTEAGEATVTSSTQEQEVAPVRRTNGHQPAQPTLAGNGQRTVAQPLEHRETPAATLSQE